MKIHVTRGGTSFGPYTLEEAAAHVRVGRLTPEDLAWVEGSEGWRPLATFLPPPPTPTTEYRCPYCGTQHPPQIVKRLSGVGWLVLVLGLLFFLIGALFALFFTEDWRMCPVCRKVFY